MDEFKVGDIVKTIRQSYGVNFSEAVVLGRYEKYICVMAKTQYSYNDWWVDPNDIIKTKQKLLDDNDLRLAKIVSTIYYDEIYEPDDEPDENGVWDADSVDAIFHNPIYVGLRNRTETIFKKKPDDVLEWLRDRDTQERIYYSTAKERHG